jgi:hypothetical protein
MKTGQQSKSSWWRALPLLFPILCGTLTAGEQHVGRRLSLQNNGLLSFSNSSTSLRGIGKSVMRLDDFELSVDGQMQMLGSSRLVREPGKGRGRHFLAKPVCVSIVATGKVLLKFNKTGETFACGTAVYRVKDRSWILDGVPLNRGAL